MYAPLLSTAAGGLWFLGKIENHTGRALTKEEVQELANQLNERAQPVTNPEAPTPPQATHVLIMCFADRTRTNLRVGPVGVADMERAMLSPPGFTIIDGCDGTRFMCNTAHLVHLAIVTAERFDAAERSER